MKNKFFLLLVCIAFVNYINAQGKSDNGQLLDSILSLAKENSIYADKATWNTISTKVKASLDKKDPSRMALVRPTQLLLEELNDFHGAILIDGKRYNGNVVKGNQPPYSRNQEIPSQLYKESIGGYKIETGMLNKTTGYINIPTINIDGDQNAVLKATATIRDSLCELLSKKPSKLIIDLRTNIGGNMYPMFAGLGVLFPDMKLGGDSKDGETFYSKWEIKAGNFFMSESQLTSIPLSCKIENNIIKYVVLTSRYTTSSGEAVASSLKGQQKITVLGEQTAGYSSTNSWYQVSENIIFSPAIAYYMSMDKSFHKNGIVPDIEIVEDLDLSTLKSGKTIEKAFDLLK